MTQIGLMPDTKVREPGKLQVMMVKGHVGLEFSSGQSIAGVFANVVDYRGLHDTLSGELEGEASRSSAVRQLILRVGMRSD